jgi:hypothetical protein
MDDDVQRIAALGFEEPYFANGSDVFKVLKNSYQGRRVFRMENNVQIMQTVRQDANFILSYSTKT